MGAKRTREREYVLFHLLIFLPMEKIKVLLVEDNDTDALLVVRQLKKEGFDVDHVQVKTREEMEAALNRQDWSLVISDYSLPGFGGNDALDLFKARCLDIPFILVSGTVGEDIAVSIMKGGANDYLMKTHLHRLGPAVKREMEETQLRRDKKRIESVLSKTEKRFQRLIQDVHDIVWMGSADGTQFHIVNPVFSQIYGRPVQELLENPGLLKEVVYEADKSHVEQMATHLMTHGACEGEYRIVRPDGEIRWIYDRQYMVIGETTEDSLRGGIISDITGKKQAEQELIQTKKAAEESSRLKSALLQNMSHEFRTPMNGILGFSQILLEELTEEEPRKKAEYICTSGRRLQQTLDSIMFYSQLTSGIPVKPVSIDLTHLVGECLESFRSCSEEKGLSVQADITPGIRIQSDVFLVQQGLTNILDNAFKFTVQGSVTVTADYQDPSQSHVSIRVADTGIGIPEEKHALIFEEFRQAEEGFNRPYEGFGLGLSIASKSVKLLGGSLSLRSRQEQGSTFTITLPVSWSGARPDIPERAIGLASIPVPAAKAKAGVPAILLVEDNEANIELVKLYLKKGYTVDVARGGEESLDMVRKKPYDCILMDINLGHGMDGIDAITGIRKLPSYQTVPIIAVTGYTFRNEKDFIISKGADYYIEKPFKRQDLIGILSEITGSG
jgi:PAS domain S-box-containing protein